MRRGTGGIIATGSRKGQPPDGATGRALARSWTVKVRLLLCAERTTSRRSGRRAIEKGTIGVLKGIVIGIVAVVIAGVASAYAAVASGLIPANADAAPSGLERWAAKTSLHATLHREAPRDAAPVGATPQNLEAGLKLYAANCAVCHGAADGKASSIADGLYQHAPQLAKHGVEDDPVGVSYWKVKHGIRLTGMPSFTAALSDTQIWQVALFLKNMDHLPPQVEAQWQRVPSAAIGPRG